ncbi:MAG: acetylglutamate kinase, partial [Chlorobia bacterium]|nr:acetylglutamate kinase [Fimbriimonadaceae bacterium]
DSAAAAIAVAIDASKLVLMTDTDGVLEDKDRPETRISSLNLRAARAMIGDGRADRGMIPKLEAAIHALEHGVDRVHLINGGTLNALLIEVFTDEGIGTMMEL